MNYKKIVISGGGILGSQIAFQSAYCGYDVTILIRKEDSKKDVEEIEPLRQLREAIKVWEAKQKTSSGRDSYTIKKAV